MSLVDDLMDALSGAGIPCSWYNTGGGCMVVLVEYGQRFTIPAAGDLPALVMAEREIMISGLEDAWSDFDGTHDDHIDGFHIGEYRFDPVYECTEFDDDAETWRLPLQPPLTTAETIRRVVAEVARRVGAEVQA